EGAGTGSPLAAYQQLHGHDLLLRGGLRTVLQAIPAHDRNGPQLPARARLFFWVIGFYGKIRGGDPREPESTVAAWFQPGRSGCRSSRDAQSIQDWRRSRILASSSGRDPAGPRASSPI